MSRDLAFQDQSQTRTGMARLLGLRQTLPRQFTVTDLVVADKRFVAGGEFHPAIDELVKKGELIRNESGQLSFKRGEVLPVSPPECVVPTKKRESTARIGRSEIPASSGRERCKQKPFRSRLLLMWKKIGDRTIILNKDWQYSGLSSRMATSSLIYRAVTNGYMRQLPDTRGQYEWTEKAKREFGQESSSPTSIPPTINAPPNTLLTIAKKREELQAQLASLAEQERQIREERVEMAIVALNALDDEGKRHLAEKLSEEVLVAMKLRRDSG